MKNKSIIILQLLLIFNFIFFCNNVYADCFENQSTSSVQQPYKIADKGKTKDSPAATGDTDEITLGGWNDIYKKEGNSFDTAQNVILGIVQMIGYTISVLTVMIVGIKYLLTSPEGKAEVKKQFTVYLIGSLLLFSGITLVSVVGKWAYQIFS